jgi:predicted small lipoprotein YifL
MRAKLLPIFALLTLISACGTKGPLETAPPMWGPDRVAYEAQKAQKAAEEAAQAAAEKAKKEAEKAESSATPDTPQ